ncbi:MAG: phosphoribosylformylglycinamidine synthase, partial [Oscillospiraceae bacterium]
MAVYRVYMEKKAPYAVEAAGVLADLRTALELPGLERVRILNRYDAERIAPEDFLAARLTVFGEPQVDVATDTLPKTDGAVFAVEYLPGQYDQRADSAAQCIQLATQKERPLIAAARIYLLEGAVSPAELAAVKRYLINPVECREASLSLPDTLETDYPAPPDVAVLDGFSTMDDEALAGLIARYGLAMDADDLAVCRDYFSGERRDPTMTELRVLDTYWSDHCRHTTFSTRLTQVSIDPPHVQDSYRRYLALRARLGRGQKPVTLMELATLGAKALRAEGLLTELDESEEINACSVHLPVDVDGE